MVTALGMSKQVPSDTRLRLPDKGLWTRGHGLGATALKLVYEFLDSATKDRAGLQLPGVLPQSGRPFIP